MQLHPTSNNVVVESLSETPTSGILIPETAKEKPEMGTIIAIGDEVSDEIKVGDVVLFKKYTPDEFILDKQTLLIMKESDVIAVIE